MTSWDSLNHLTDLRQVFAQWGVARAWLFGSRTRNEGSDSSDWDILVEFREPPTFDTFMGLKTMLEDRLKGPVDLLSKSACKPRLLKAIEPELRHVA